MDGLLYSDHTPTPGLLEYKKAIEPVQVTGFAGYEVEIVNRYDFLKLDHLQCKYSIVGDGYSRSGGLVPIPDVGPGETGALKFPKSILDDQPAGEAYLQVSFVLKEDTLWARAGHEISLCQVQLQPPLPITIEPSLSEPKVEAIPPGNIDSPKLKVITQSSTWTFDLLRGKITSWVKDSTELLHADPYIDFYRAQTDNDRPSAGRAWSAALLAQTTDHCRRTSWQRNPDHTVTVRAELRIAPPTLDWAIHARVTYTFHSNGALCIHVRGVPKGRNLPPTLARSGITLPVSPLLARATWFGRGPGEAYRDKKRSQMFGTHVLPVDALHTPYERPQENGNRTDVRWVRFEAEPEAEPEAKVQPEPKPEPKPEPEVEGKPGVGFTARFPGDGASFAASRYLPEDLEACGHPYELRARRRERVFVRLDAAHHGLGTGSCGPETLEAYALRCEPFEWEVVLE